MTDSLTDRELEVVLAVSEGLSNKQIAERLRIRPLTVKSHLARVGVKLGVGDRAGIVGAAFRLGLLQAPAAKARALAEVRAASDHLASFYEAGNHPSEVER